MLKKIIKASQSIPKERHFVLKNAVCLRVMKYKLLAQPIA